MEKNCTRCRKLMVRGFPASLMYYTTSMGTHGWHESNRYHPHLLCKDCCPHPACGDPDAVNKHCITGVAAPYVEHVTPCAACGFDLSHYTSEADLSSPPDTPEPVRTCGPECRAKLLRKIREPAVIHDPKPCGHCGESFTPKRSTARFCSPKCRVYASRAA